MHTHTHTHAHPHTHTHKHTHTHAHSIDDKDDDEDCHDDGVAEDGDVVDEVENSAVHDRKEEE